MSDISIKMKIGERIYPMKAKASEEAKVRAAGKLLNERIEKYIRQYTITDKQDLLAMVAFDCVVESLSLTAIGENSKISQQLDNMISLIDRKIAD